MTKRRRSALSPDDARKQYIRAAETVLLEQIQVDARRLDRQDDERRVAVGPFAKLNAEQVAAAADGKSRGAITNLFKSQRQFQLQAMALVLEDPEVDVLVLPDPRSSMTRSRGSRRWRLPSRAGDRSTAWSRPSATG